MSPRGCGARTCGGALLATAAPACGALRGSATFRSEQLPLIPESRVVPHRPARCGREEDSGLALQAGWFSLRVRVSGVLF